MYCLVVIIKNTTSWCVIKVEYENLSARRCKFSVIADKKC